MYYYWLIIGTYLPNKQATISPNFSPREFEQYVPILIVVSQQNYAGVTWLNHCFGIINCIRNAMYLLV